MQYVRPCFFESKYSNSETPRVDAGQWQRPLEFALLAVNANQATPRNIMIAGLAKPSADHFYCADQQLPFCRHL